MSDDAWQCRNTRKTTHHLVCNLDRQLASVNFVRLSPIFPNRNRFAGLPHNRGVITPAKNRKVLEIVEVAKIQLTPFCIHRKKNLCGRVEVTNIPDYMNWQV